MSGDNCQVWSSLNTRPGRGAPHDIDDLWNQRSFDEGDNELGGPFMVVEKVATKK